MRDIPLRFDIYVDVLEISTLFLQGRCGYHGYLRMFPESNQQVRVFHVDRDRNLTILGLLIICF